MKVQNAEGKALAAVIHTPKGDGPFPAVLVLHGYCGCKDEHHIATFTEALSENGILAIRFDSFGVNESEGKFEEDFRVSQYISDVEAVQNFMIEQGSIDSSKMAICGHSLGASISIISAARSENWVGCCAIQPPTKITRKGGTHELEYWKKVGAIAQELGAPMRGKVMLPADYAIDADQWDALDFAPKVSCPMMIMYGTEDIDVLPDITLSIYQAANHDSTKLVKLEGVGHGFQSNPEDLNLVTDHLVGFMKDTLFNIR
jgi:hypothetical protein